MKRALLLLSFAACADPAALRVNVDVREPNLALLRIGVTNDRSEASILACSFPAGTKADDTCLLDGGNKKWDGELAPLSFWLYGRPKTDLRISAAGFRTPDSTAAATSTEAIAALPERSGDEAELNLVLVGRTNPKRDCTATIPETSSDRTSLAVYDLVPDPDGSPEILAVSGNRIAIRHYRRVGENCVLETPVGFEEATALPCQINENSLIVGPASGAGARMFAGTCNNANPPRMIGAIIQPMGMPVRFSATGTVPDARYSRPVLADLDGDDAPEIYFVQASIKDGMAQPPLRLAQWTQGSAEIRVLGLLRNDALPPGLQAYQPANVTMNGGPLAVYDPRLRHDVLIIGGYRFGVGVVTGVSPLEFTRIPEDGSMLALGPSAAAFVEGGRNVTVQVVSFYGPEVRVNVLKNDDWTHATSFSVRGPEEPIFEGAPLPMTRDFRPALGDLDGSGELSAVTVLKGTAYVYPLKDGAMAREIPFWPGIETDIQAVLTANIDGRAGAEILAFNNNPNQVNAVTSTGEVPDGWPIDTLGGGTPRVAVAELDPGSNDLEVITLVNEKVKVFSLGPGSFDPGATPWPSRDHDAAQRGVIYIR